MPAASTSSAAYDTAVISGVCLSTMKQLLYGREYDGAGWYALEGFCDEVTETTDASDATVKRRLVLTGFHDREPQPLDAAALATAPHDVGVLVVRPALVASPSQLTFQETTYLQSLTSTKRVMLLVTMSQPEVGSARTDFVLLQSTRGTHPEALPLTILNLGDTIVAFDALVSAVRLHPEAFRGDRGDTTTSANAKQAHPYDQHIVEDLQRNDAATQALLREAEQLRNEIFQLQEALK